MKPDMTVDDFIKKARDAGHDALGIAYDEEFLNMVKWEEFIVMWALLGIMIRYRWAFWNTDWCL